VAAEGPTLTLTSSNTISSETVWSGSGVVVSIDFAQPSYQNRFSGSFRQTVDVALDADQNTDHPIYHVYHGGGVWCRYPASIAVVVE
jgi:hypothetical protein